MEKFTQKGGNHVKEYLEKQKGLNLHLQIEANKIATELISKNVGKSTMTLRKSALDFICRNQLPDDISYKVKSIIDDFISNIEIPTQKNE